MSGLLVMFIIAGRLPSSEVFISAMGIGSAYYGLGTAIAFGLNAGFQVLAARCHPLKYYHHAQEFMKKQFYLINGFNFILLIYVVACCFWFDAVYATRPG